MKIILASASPRRREILTTIGLAPDEIMPSDADETIAEGTPAHEAVMILSERKAESVAKKAPADSLLIASDTVVVLDGEILGKPRDRQDAYDMLSRLSGRIHSVYTGVCMILNEKKSVFYQKTDVEFYPLTDADINAYLDTGEPFDKAGAYGIQGRGSVLVKGIDGDFFTVMGLPAAEVYRTAERFCKNDE